MKGDFSYLSARPADAYTGVRHQQGRVLLDRDWNDAQQIEAELRTRAATDTFGPGVLAVPLAEGDAFKLLKAAVDGSAVRVVLAAGHAWASGMPVALPGITELLASYVEPPLAPATSVASIAAGLRDALFLEVWEDTVSAFQVPADLLEPALGGPDTTARTRVFQAARLLRLGPNDDCGAVGRLVDDFSAKGRLTVSPAPVLAVGGDCPLEAGGGYTGLEHYLYRVEVAEPAGGQARFKWSQFNGGLVGRGVFTAGAPGLGTVNVTANVAPIDLCGVSNFWLEALIFDAALGAWRSTFTADATRSSSGVLSLGNVQGVWPGASPATAFFRLWNGIARVADFPPGAPVELKDGIRLEFQAPAAGNTNYRPGDYWTFPVRASGAAFDPPVWPLNAPPHGVVIRRVAVAEITWNVGLAADFDAGDIEDCRRIFRPLRNQKICCTFNVGDGRGSFGDFNRIEDALRHLPAAGGEICLLPGLHETNAVIQNRSHVTIRGCGVRTKLTPRAETPTLPIFLVFDSSDIELLHMDLFTLGGSAIVVEGSKPGAAHDILIAEHRILACDNAVRARNVAGLEVHHNRIRMLDKRGSGVGIYLAGDDSRIERNDIRLLPFEDMPPIEVPDEPEPLDPTDPCARVELAFANPRIFIQYVDVVWAVFLPLLPVVAVAATPPYRALGGIQLGGGSERVKVLDNTVVGGAGNGITLGAVAAVTGGPPRPVFSFEMTDPDARVIGIVIGPDGKPLAGVQVTLTPLDGGSTPQPDVSDADGQVTFGLAKGTYRVDEGAAGVEIAGINPVRRDNGFWVVEIKLQNEAPPADADDGFLYDIAIERNTVSAMGLSGIGVPTMASATGNATSTASALRGNSAVNAARALLGCPITGLVIRANTLTGNLRNPFDNALRAEAAVRGVGGISLGFVDDALIEGNRIEKNGASAIDPLCGIFIQYGEDIDIHHNQVLDQGGLPNGDNDKPTAGQRGGINLGLVSSFSLLAQLRGGSGSTGARPAARIFDNTVTQPVGCALNLRAIGPLMVNDNAFASEFAGPTPYEMIAGTVLIFNLGGVQNSGAGIDIKRSGSVGGTSYGAAVAAPPPAPAPAAAPAAAPAPAPAPAQAASASGSANLGMNQRARMQPTRVAVTRDAAAERLLPSGNTMFDDNQSRTGPAHRAAGCHLVLSFDDVSYQDNQSYSAQASTVFANVMVVASTLRAVGNRLSERNSETLMSLWTLAQRANNTSMNQADHCIIATDANPGMPEILTGNQVLFPSSLCARVNMTNALLFKPLE